MMLRVIITWLLLHPLFSHHPFHHRALRHWLHARLHVPRYMLRHAHLHNLRLFAHCLALLRHFGDDRSHRINLFTLRRAIHLQDKLVQLVVRVSKRSRLARSRFTPRSP